jgi:hypothetical protein
MEIMEGLPEILYHITLKSKINKIKKEGLKLSKPKDIEDVVGIYLFKSKNDAHDAAINWYIDRFDEDEDFLLISINSKYVLNISDEAANYEIICLNIIQKKPLLILKNFNQEILF